MRARPAEWPVSCFMTTNCLLSRFRGRYGVGTTIVGADEVGPVGQFSPFRLPLGARRGRGVRAGAGPVVWAGWQRGGQRCGARGEGTGGRGGVEWGEGREKGD